MNANGISNTVLTQTDQIEANIPEDICCEKSAASADDPLIEACESDDSKTVVVFSFEESGCSKTTTETTVFYDLNGDVKVTQVIV